MLAHLLNLVALAVAFPAPVWVAGPPDATNFVGSYGSQGSYSTANQIPARTAHNMVVDVAFERILVFGGAGYDGSTPCMCASYFIFGEN